MTIFRLVAGVALIALLTSCDKPSSPAPSPTVSTVQVPAPTAPVSRNTPPPATTPDSANVVGLPPTPAIASDSDQSTSLWLAAKTSTYDQRAGVFPVVAQLEARVDQQIAELNAKRATMTGTTQTNKWDFAMNEMHDARAYLHSMILELRDATSENWDQLKDKVDRAWVRTQDAVSKVKASTTS